jgi:hypothetical protein
VSIFTYVGLVLRRIWARRLMLLGSFLGATLVTSLLVVLPLYEGSVSAVDLLFTFRQAPDAALDLTAVHSTNQYTPAQAVAARAAVDDAAEPLGEWYPTIDERILSREFAVIPLGVPDWLARAEEWREAGGITSGSAPYPTPPQEATQTRIITAHDIVEQVEILEGEFPVGQDPAVMDEPILQVVIGPTLARLTDLGVGDRVVLRAFVSQPDWFETVEVAGIGFPIDPGIALWDVTDPSMLVMLAPQDFDTWTGTFEADPEADPWLRATRGFRRVTTNQTFTLDLDRSTVSLENVESLARNVRGFVTEAARSEGLRTVTRLPGLIEDFDVRSVVLGAPILAMLALIVAGALYFLVYMAALALERDANDLALLRMRGASTWQTTGLHMLQSALIAVGAILVAPIVARFLVGLTGRIPPMSTLTGGDALGVSQSRSVVPFVLAGGALTFLSMGLAILPFARRSVLELRALSTRPAHKSVWQRYNLDLFLVALAGVILFELRQQGLVDTDPSELGLDPFSIAAPALFLLAGSLLLLRALPWLLRGVGWLMTRTPGMTAALPGWHLGRNPIPYGRLALLVWLTTGFGAFALTYSGTLETSYQHRAEFAAGSDARIVAPGAAYLEAPEGAEVTPVYRSTGAPRLASRGSELLAVDPATFSDVVFWRGDFGADPDLLFSDEILGPPVDWGVELSTDAAAIVADGVVVPPPWTQRDISGPSAPVRLMVRLVDEDGRFRIHAADIPFDDTGWKTVTVSLDGDGAINGPFEDGETLVVQAMWLETDAAALSSSLEAGRMLIDGIGLVTEFGDEEDLLPAVLEELTAKNDLMVDQGVSAAAAANQYFSNVPEGEDRGFDAVQASPLYRSGEAVQWAYPRLVRGDAVPHVARTPERLAFITDDTVASFSGLPVGIDVPIGVDGQEIDAVVTAHLSLIPTTGDARFNGVLVTRLDGLMQWLSGEPAWSLTGTIARTPLPQELWIRTEDVNADVEALVAELEEEPDAVITANGVSADFSSRPIQVGLVSILLLGTGAGIVLALAGVTAYVLVAVRRRYREMGVLRALGLRRRSVAGTFALEQVVVLGVGAVIGVVAGLGLMRLMIPFLQLGEEAEDLIPPAVMQVSAARLGLYISIVAGLLVVSVLWSTRSVSARRLSEVLREVER